MFIPSNSNILPINQKLISLAIWLLACFIQLVSARYEHICTEEGLFTPYVHVYQGRKGPKIINAGPGFIELSSNVDAYVCVNGPAYLYFNINNTFGQVYEAPEFNIYSHMCGLYNKSPHRGHGHADNPKKLMGILLMGQHDDYRKPAIQLFQAPAYNYETNVYENGTSLMVFGNKDCIIQKNGVNITIKLETKPKPEYCFRVYNDKDAVKEEENVLRADAPIKVIGCDLPPVTPALAPPSAPPSAPPPAPPPESGLPPIRKRRAPGPDPPPPPPVEIKVTSCKELPDIEVECKNGQLQTEDVCKIFKVMTGKEEPGYATEDEWKKNVLLLISEIFTQSCTIVSSKLPKAVNRLMGYYLVKAKAEDKSGKTTTPSTYWAHLTKELEECLAAKTRLYFKEQIVGGTRQMAFYKNGKTPITLVPITEEAEIEYEFNWVVDMHWKIFATVVGICTAGESRTSSITSLFYSMYVEDFLTPANKTWVDIKDNALYEIILSEFYGKETESWVQSCLEASFIETNSQKYRPIRPLLVGDAREDNYFTGGPFEGEPSPNEINGGEAVKRAARDGGIKEFMGSGFEENADDTADGGIPSFGLEEEEEAYELDDRPTRNAAGNNPDDNIANAIDASQNPSIPFPDSSEATHGDTNREPFSSSL